MKSGIYQIINKTNNHSYIGSAVDISGRWATHISSLKRNRHHSIYLQRAWNKYGEDAFEFIILEHCVKELLIFKEQFYLNEINPEYNICKIAGSSLGTKGTLESNLKKSLNHFRRGKFGKDNPCSKPVYQYSLTGEFIKEWENAVVIQRELGFNEANIRTSIKKRNTFYNFFWSYNFYGEFYKDVPIRKDRSKTKKPIIQYNINGEFIREWDSAKSATIFLGKREGSLNSCLKNKNNTKISYGYIWEYKKKS